ncbi:putative multidrug resistance protein fnx1 [Ustulina deusta]|nr:putative multidrug resistance protein fnx1 [Ustulina deusta]
MSPNPSPTTADIPLRAVVEGEVNIDEKTNARDATPARSGHDANIHGPRVYFIACSLAVMVFLVVLEILPIVPAALVAVSNDIGGFNELSWAISSYLLGRVGVMVIFAKLSDIVGRKLIFTISIVISVIFSGLCGASQTLTQLIVFRAFQGVGGGGGGAYSLSTVILTELVPPAKLAKATAQLSLLTTLANTPGPIIGGAISRDTTWPALVAAVTAIPKGFPNHKKSPQRSRPGDLPSLSPSLARLDLGGVILLLIATVSRVAGFEEAGSRFPWRSPYVITLLVISGLCWIALIIWERHLTLSDDTREPLLPWRFFTNRAMLGILMVFFLLGGPLVVTLYQIPQVFGLVYGLSDLDAGIRVVPFTALWSVGLIVAPTLAGRLKVPPIYIILVGCVIQVIAFSLLGTLPISTEIPPQIYAYEVIAGLGCGLVFPLLFVMTPFVNEGRDRAVAMAAEGQFQVMGSAVLLSVATAIFNGYTRSRLESLLGTMGSDSFLNLGNVLPSLSTCLQQEVRLTLAEGYNRQSLVLAVAAGAQVPFTFLL